MTDVAELVERLLKSSLCIPGNIIYQAASALQAQAAEIERLRGREKSALDLAERHMNGKHAAEAKLREAVEVMRLKLHHPSNIEVDERYRAFLASMEKTDVRT